MNRKRLPCEPSSVERMDTPSPQKERNGVPFEQKGPARPADNEPRKLQSSIEVRWRAGNGPPKWSRRRTFIFIVVASLLLWGAVIAGLLAVV